METVVTTPANPTDYTWWLFALPAFLRCHVTLDSFALLAALIASFLLPWLLTPGGTAWRNGRGRLGRVPIPGPRGLPVLGSLLTLHSGLAHRTLALLARSNSATKLMAISVGATPTVVSSDPSIAREILSHPSFADRPLKRSARELMFGRAMGFAPAGTYWRLLRRVASSHLFAPHRISAGEPSRRKECDSMLRAVATEQTLHGRVGLRRHLQTAALNNIMSSVFGKTYRTGDGNDDKELAELRYLVREAFDLLGSFNWTDHLPWLSFFYDHHRVSQRCAELVPRVRRFVKDIIDGRKLRAVDGKVNEDTFVDVLLSLEGEEKLGEDDIVAVLWEMIFRGTDTTALLTEWVMAELVLHQDIQRKLRAELDAAGSISDGGVAKLPYLQAVLKETLRVHPPGPLLSWARLSTSDVQLSNGMLVPALTTVMVNMWSITHDSDVWSDPDSFDPERFVRADVDVRGGDLRLAPFGAGRRVCPGKNAGMAAVGQWVARLVQEFEWVEAEGAEVRLDEVLKLSCEMKYSLVAVAVPRGVTTVPARS